MSDAAPKRLQPSEPTPQRLFYLGLRVIYTVYLSYTCISLDDAPDRPIATLNFQAAESDIRTWINGYLSGQGRGYDAGIQDLRSRLKEIIGICNR